MYLNPNRATLSKFLSLLAAILFSITSAYAIIGDWKILRTEQLVANVSEATISSNFCPGVAVHQCAVLLDELGHETSFYVLWP